MTLNFFNDCGSRSKKVDFYANWAILDNTIYEQNNILTMRALGALNGVQSRPIATILRINQNNSDPSQPVMYYVRPDT